MRKHLRIFAIAILLISSLGKGAQARAVAGRGNGLTLPSPKESGWGEASYALIKRIVPTKAGQFVVKFIPKDGDKDVFELESKNGKIILGGNNGVSVASSLNYYLKN